METNLQPVSTSTHCARMDFLPCYPRPLSWSHHHRRPLNSLCLPSPHLSPPSSSLHLLRENKIMAKMPFCTSAVIRSWLHNVGVCACAFCLCVCACTRMFECVCVSAKSGSHCQEIVSAVLHLHNLPKMAQSISLLLSLSFSLSLRSRGSFLVPLVQAHKTLDWRPV